MKKYIMMLALAASFTLVAGGSSTTQLFNRGQFQPHKATAATPEYMLTVPIVYKGSMTSTGVFIDDLADVCVDRDRGSYQLYMTICQPCIDCYPCRMVSTAASDTALPMQGWGDAAVDPGKITKWNLYVILESKKTKTALVQKVDLTDTEESVFFTGSPRGEAAVKGIEEPTFFMTGKKSDFKFKYLDAVIIDEAGTWAVTNGGKQTGYVKSVTSFTGGFTYAAVDKNQEIAANVQCSLKLTRNTSLTKKAFEGVFASKVTKKGKNWEDCRIDMQATICENYYTQGWDPASDGMDAFIVDAYGAKKWTVVGGDASFAEATMSAFDFD